MGTDGGRRISSREWFETDLLQAAIAARGIFGTGQGPRSAGTAALLLLNAAIDPAPGGSSVTVKGGPGALTRAMAAPRARRAPRSGLAAGVAASSSIDGRVSGVLLEDGTRDRRDSVISNADPKRTLLDLVDPVDLDPGFLTRIRNYRCRGNRGEDQPRAVVAARRSPGSQAPAELRGRLHVGPSIDYLERAFDASKYGDISARALPRYRHPDTDRSVARTCRENT